MDQLDTRTVNPLRSDSASEHVQQYDTRAVNPLRADTAERSRDVQAHLVQAQLAQEKAERDREVIRDKDVPFTERAKAAGDLALRRAESAYHDASASLRQPH